MNLLAMSQTRPFETLDGWYIAISIFLVIAFMIGGVSCGLVIESK